MSLSVLDAACGAVDAGRCPICEQANQCAMEQARRDGAAPPSSCWCTKVHFSAELLALVPAHARRKACICHACASAVPSVPLLTTE